MGILLSRNDTIPEIVEVNHPLNQILQDHPDRAGRNFGEHPGLILVLDKSSLVVSLSPITINNQHPLVTSENKNICDQV